MNGKKLYRNTENKMLAGVYRRVAYFATGALMSPQSCYQGETIPCISHGIVLEA